MLGFIADIEDLAEDNENFRRVLFTAGNMQLVLMSLEPGEDIGLEIHEHHDQFFRIEKGVAVVEIDGQRTRVGDDEAVIVPAGARHNLINIGTGPLRLYTLYSPPHHPDGLVHRTKREAMIAKAAAMIAEAAAAR